MHLLKASQNDLNWHFSIHWIVEAEEGLFISPNTGFPWFCCSLEMIFGAASVPKSVAPMMVPPMWYNLSIAFSRMVTRVVSTLSNVLRKYLMNCHHFLAMRCLVSVSALAGIPKNAPTLGASIHSFVDRIYYSGRDMM